MYHNVTRYFFMTSRNVSLGLLFPLPITIVHSLIHLPKNFNGSLQNELTTKVGQHMDFVNVDQ